MTKEEAIQEIAKDFKLIRDLYEDGKKDELMWFKNILMLVYRFVKIGALQEGHGMMALIPLRYFLSDLPNQMVEDPAFDRIIFAICSAFEVAGLIKPSGVDDFRPTQKPAKA